MRESEFRSAIVSGEPDECWAFTGATNPMGYGVVRTPRGKNKLAHRWMWELVNGLIPERLCVLHTCDNPPCCNPEHLWLGTRVDNNRDMCAKGRHGKTGARGEKNNHAKLTTPQVKQIKMLLAQGWLGKDIAPAFGVSVFAVSDINRGRSWRWVNA